MGAGRKTVTFTVSEVPQQNSSVNGGLFARNLKKPDLGGIIFGCKHGTYKECLRKQLFGLPAPHFSYVKNIEPGLPLFLFNYSDRKLHGIFEAVSQGQLSIDPYAWPMDGLETTPFPAQVRIRMRKLCLPLLEDQFRPIIAKNYYDTRLFFFELDRAQTNKLIGLFKTAPPAPKLSTVKGKDTEKRETSGTVSGAPIEYQDSNGASVASSQREDKKLTHPTMGQGSTRTIPSSVLSYSSVVKNSSASDAQPSQSTAGCTLNAQNAGGGPGGRKMLLLGRSTKHEVAGKPEKEVWHQSLDSNGTYTSMRSSDASLAHKNWTALFKDGTGCDKDGKICDTKKNIEETASDAIEYAEDLRRPALETNSHHLNEHSVDIESHNLAHSTSGVCQDVNGCQDLEDSGECDDLGFKEYGEDLYSSLVTEDGTSVAKCSQNFLAMQSENGIENSTAVFFGTNVHGSANICRGWHSSLRLPDFWDMQPDRSNTEEVENQSIICTSPDAVLSDINYSGMHSIVDKDGMLLKLLAEVKELKSSHLQQVEKINSLEKELVESRLELQQLKDQSKTLDVEKEEFHPADQPYSTVCLVGGFDGHSWLTSLELYSPTLDRIENLGPTNCVRSYSALTKLNSELFLLGGFYGDVWYNAVESYNPEYNRWLSHPPLYRRKGNLAGVSSQGKVFAIGGGNGVECFPDVEMFDPCAGRWISAQPLVEKRFSPAAVEFKGALYVAGGFDGKYYLKSFERLDPREHSWKSLESMCTNRACHSLAVLNEKLYAIGGYDGAKMIPTVEVYDPRAGSWMTGKRMNNSRGYFGTVVIGDSIHVIGGLKDDIEILDKVEYYMEGNDWQETNWRAIGKRCFLSAIAL